MIRYVASPVRLPKRSSNVYKFSFTSFASEKGPESFLPSTGESGGCTTSRAARFMASSIMVVRPAVALLRCCGPSCSISLVTSGGKPVFAGSMELTPDEDVDLKLAKEALGLIAGKMGESSMMVTAWESWVGRPSEPASSSTRGVELEAEVLVLSGFAAATLRLANVGTLGPEPAFFTSIGRGVKVRPTNGLLLLANPFGTLGFSGDRATVGFCDAGTWTLTIVGLLRSAC